MDEFEEWELIQNHYFMLLGKSGQLANALTL
jgi:hypothetical protein